MSRSGRLPRQRAWLFAATLALVQVSLVTPPATQHAEAAKKKAKKKKAKAAEAAPASESDEILSITSGALGDGGGEGGGESGGAPIDDPEAGLDGPTSSPKSSAPAAPRGGPPPDALVALDKPRLRRVAVPPYVGRSAESLRQAVLEVLTQHTDLEVLGSADLEMVEKRIHLSARDAESWPRLATELALYGLVVGDGDASRLRVIDAKGRTLGTLALDPKQRLDVQARERLWPELGRFLSDEGARQHRVAVMRASADAVMRGQGEELYRQKELADRRAKLREERLAAASGRAASRLAAQDAELARQASVAQERIRQQQLAAAKAAEDARQRAATAMRQQELAAKQQQAALAAQQQQQQAPAAGYGTAGAAYAAPPTAPAPAPYGGGYGAQPAYGSPPLGAPPAAQPYAPAPASPAPPPVQAGPAPAPAVVPGAYANRGGYVPKSQQPPAAEAPPAR